MKVNRISALALVFSALLTSVTGAREAGEPEAATGYVEKKAFVADEFMVVAANPYASWAGKNIIDRGGNAIDAAVAIQAMLTLVEPQSSGIGGGSFILYWDNQSKTLHTIDGRETAPANTTPYWFIKNGKPMGWLEGVVGGKSVGVPGTVRALELAHKKYGKLAWQQLFKDTIDTATQGFTVSPRMAKLLALRAHPGLPGFPASASYFYPAGEPLQAGKNLKNKALADTLTGIAEQGADFFYTGALAEEMVRVVNTAPTNPGQLTLADLAEYKPIERAPVCGEYRDKKICGMAPPSSGGVSVYQIVKMLEGFSLHQYQPTSVEFAHLYTQASALAYADREQYIADTDFVELPFAALINPAYLRRRAEGISLEQNWHKVKAGKIANTSFSAGISPEQANTSHFVVVDKQGNAVSITSSVEFMFGSGLMVGGFVLNNQLTDFSFQPRRADGPVPNRVEPGKRPRSAMSPTMLFDKNGDLELLIGSPGGSRIVSYVAQTIIGVVDFGLDVQQAINLPKITNRNDYTALEKGTPAQALEQDLSNKGHAVRVIDLNSGLHGIQRKNGKLIGGADPRREGIAVGQ